MRFFKFYIQKEGTDSSGNAYPVKESGKDFGVYEKECKFYGGRELKDIAKRDWHDHNGDDEFIPAIPVFKAKSIEIKFACKGDLYSSNNKIKSFMEALAENGSMKIYDEYNHIGRRGVRFDSIPDEATLYRKMDGVDEALVFTVKMKINDPVTEVSLVTDKGGNVTDLRIEQ